MKALNGLHLTGLRAVEVVGRHGSLRAAAQELGVTPGAVSQHIIKAEAHLGCQLFARNPHGMALTHTGKQVAEHLSEGFRALARGATLAKDRQSDAIAISVPPIFAGKWLVWRLNRFNKAHPSIKLRIEATVNLIDLQLGDAEASIRVGYGDWPGVHAKELFPQRVFPVCAPHVAETLTSLNDLKQVPIVRDINTMFSWDVWLKPNGMTEGQLGDGPEYSDAALCLDAAIAGQGVFLAWETLAQDALAIKQLVAPFPGRFRTGISYWFVEADGRQSSPAIEAFYNWLISELPSGLK